MIMNNKEFLSETIKIRNSLKDLIFIAYNSDSDSIRYWINKRNKLNDLYDRFEFAWIDWLNNANKIIEDERWKQINIAKKEKRMLKKLPFNKKLDPFVIKSLTNDFIDDIDFTISNSKKPFNLLLRLIETDNKRGKAREKIKAFLEEDEVEKIIREANDYSEARKKLIDELIKRADDDQFITLITDKIDPKTGIEKIIRFNIKKYAERLLRTVTRQLQTDATLMAAAEVDSDLVQVSSHNTNCPICIEYEGKIYSISGKSRIFPPLIDSPPYHPYCLHSITVMFEEVLYMRGIDKYIDFSQGRTEIHPTIKDWIPPSERNIA